MLRNLGLFETYLDGNGRLPLPSGKQIRSHFL